VAARWRGLPTRRKPAVDVAIAAVLWVVASTQADPPVPQFTYVPGLDGQPGGPVHDFRVGRHEVTNAQFAAFLNDALNNLNNERGAYLYFDTDSGDVYINTSSTGQKGTSGSGTLMFSAAVGGCLSYNVGQGVYLIASGCEQHPVIGVSWYGALKYCNWLTLATGLTAAERVYGEAANTNLSGWRPVTISAANWAVRDLNSAEREALLGYLGYRLPMDARTDAAAVYNEWYKAAAWDESCLPAGCNHLYGFGRDVITGPDANFRYSGDPFDNGTTPVAYYDGSDHGGTYQTNAEQNYYGLYDASGNIWEWMQDQGVAATDRRNRGGSWNSTTSSLRTALGADRAANSTSNVTGFRVVQAVHDDVLVTPQADYVVSGPWGGPYSDAAGAREYTVTNVTDQDATFSVTLDAEWLEVEGGLPVNVTLVPGESYAFTVRVAPACATDELTLGENIGTVGIVYGPPPGTVIERLLRLTVTEPLNVEPSGGLAASMRYRGTPNPGSKLYTLTNGSDLPVLWSATWEETTATPSGLDWLTLNGTQPPVGGEVPAQGTAPVTIAIDAGAAAGLDLGTFTAEVTFADGCTGSVWVRAVSLQVLPWFSVAPSGTQLFSGPAGGPFAPAQHQWQISNLASETLPWRVEVQPTSSWFALNTYQGTLPALGSTQVAATLTYAAEILDIGSYDSTLRFQHDPGSGFTVERTIGLTVNDWVTPAGDISFTRPLGGEFTPPSSSCTLAGNALGERWWSAEFVPESGADWLDVNPTEGLILEPNGSTLVTIEPNDVAAQLPAGVYVGDLIFTDTTFEPAFESTRRVTLVITAAGVVLDLALVTGDAAAPPAYNFRIGRFEVTNHEYCLFLNDALANVNNERGAWLYFDVDSGNVYLHTSQTGTQGTSGTGTVLFDAAANGYISFTGGRYVPQSGFENHPVGGVSWYGALKFCNWLTLIHGMSGQRVYHEGYPADQWCPLGTPAELRQWRGFRLPVDDGAAAVSTYNEWYKAAAWLPETVLYADYGFGRNVITVADANFYLSLDPFADTTPVGFYDGVHEIAGPIITNDTANGYGLYDMTGNVSEWMQDVGGTASERATRGGNYTNAIQAPLLRADGRNSQAASAAYRFLGFRVAQALPDTLTQFDLTPVPPQRLEAYVGGPYDLAEFVLAIENAGDYTLDTLSVTVDAAWLALDTSAGPRVPPGATAEARLRVSEAVDTLGVSPAPPGSGAWVPADAAQPGGPAYDYWVAQFEVRNSDFAAFLNNAYQDAVGVDPGPRSEYMYFDTDSGNVHIHDTQEPAAGTDGAGPLLYDAGAGHIQFVGGAYVVDDGYTDHPVTGVTWYGALKYCNWLTLNAGLPPELRVYTEAPSTALSSWHPVTVSDADWIAGAFDPANIVAETIGYRLPLDAEAGASGYNEWYKAAAWDDATGGEHTYGFGRGTLTAADANFRCSGDPFEDEDDCTVGGTTPRGFFDGANVLGDGETPTTASGNGFALFDLCGNAAEWVQGNAYLQQAARGGGWDDAPESAYLTNATRQPLAPDLADAQVGFRVVRNPGRVAAITVTDSLSGATQKRFVLLHLREPFLLTPGGGISYAGMYRSGQAAGTTQLYEVTNRSAAAMPWALTADKTWLTVTGPTPGQASGTLDAGQQGAVTLTLNSEANALGPGTHVAVATWRNTRTNEVRTRNATVNVAWPIAVTPPDDAAVFTGFYGGPFINPNPCTFALSSLVSFNLQYQVSCAQPWVSITGQYPLSGTLTPGAGLSFDVSVDEDAASLAVGEYDAVLVFRFTDPGNDNLSATLEETVTVVVQDPIFITPTEDPWEVGPELDPLPFQVYTLTNARTDRGIDVHVAADVDWLDVGSATVTVLPGGAPATMTVSVNELALQLYHGTYVGTVQFTDTYTGHVQTRTVRLHIVETLSVGPRTGLTAYGVPGGPILDPTAIYTLVNYDTGAIQWRAESSEPNSWVLLNGGTGPVVDSLPSAGTTHIVVAIDVGNATIPPLQEGENQAEVVFTDLTNAVSCTRLVSLTLVNPHFAVSSAHVAADVLQPGGPAYNFEMSAYHTTNAEFAAFLNDALTTSAAPRGAYMFFHTTTGDVYVNTTAARETGASPGTRTVKMFAPAAGGRISYDDGTQMYSVQTGYEAHPVTGASWYGALKYCNWLTLDQGMSPEQRCYNEASDADLAGWRPVTATGTLWSTRDLNDDERLALVENYRGYRLPMDEGYNNPDVSVDFADGYNEWYKAAAWNSVLARNTVYGCGRDTLTGADANYKNSGDPFDNSTTPVGYYDGSNHGGSFTTNANANTFQLFDMSGNVYQWLQGRYTPGSFAVRTVRGGSYSTVHPPTGSESLATNRRNFADPRSTLAQIGFRVVRALRRANGDADGDGRVDYDDLTALADCLTGPRGGVFPDCGTLDFDGDDDVDLADVAAFQQAFTGP